MAAIIVVQTREDEGHLLRIKGERQRFSPCFWRFYAAAFFFDLGIGLFFFLFNLYLTDLHFDERAVGNITASLTFGNVAGTVPAMLLARRHGLRPLLLFTVICAPLICALRVLILWGPAQIGLSFATGVALCCWPICFSPTVALLTEERNRTFGFSIMFATGIGMGTFAGLLGGYIPELLYSGKMHISIVGGIRIVLFMACGIILAGAWPLWRLRLQERLPGGQRSTRLLHPFLLRFLPPFVVWNVVTGSFPAFGAIYLQQVLHIPLGRVGAVFSGSQLAQFAAVLGAPILFRRSGLIKGIVIAQVGTALFLVLIGKTAMVPAAITFYLAYNAMQFMSGPGIYNLLMNRIPEVERSTASAVQNLSGAICQAATQALTGLCIVQFGYRPVLIGNAAFAILAALLFLRVPEHATSAEPMADKPMTIG
ncbi:MAG TPA: MFS transporter [Terracidiphilus sp.]|jgi:MFS family permease